MTILPVARFPISDLVRRTGVPPATIHHYLGRGMLPPPVRAARNRFLYDERHEQGLRLIRLLRRRRGLSLETIAEVLPDLLGLTEEQAFRPEMWDRVLGIRDRVGRLPAERLLEAAKDAFARGSDVNVEEICRRAGVAKASFYRHYRSKEELFFAAAGAVGVEISDRFLTEAGDRPLPEDRAARVLAPLLEPRLPLLLDLLAGALQRRAGYRAAAAGVLHGLHAGVGEGVKGGEAAAGQRVFDRALGLVLARLAEARATTGRAHA